MNLVRNLYQTLKSAPNLLTILIKVRDLYLKYENFKIILLSIFYYSLRLLSIYHMHYELF